jgi:ribosomal protein L17
MKTQIIAVACLLVLFIPGLNAQSSDAQQAATAIKHSIEELVAIRKIKGVDERRAALKGLKKPDDVKVAKALAPFLIDKDPIVSQQALMDLRYMKNSSALDALIKFAKRSSVLRDPKLYREVLLAVGQHGSKRALPILIDNVWHPKSAGLFGIRVLAIAHIREKESVDQLIEIMRKGKSGGRRKGGMSPAQRTVAQGLFTLTGHKIERGSASEWSKWWRANRSSFDIPKTPVKLSAKESKQWQRLWTSPEAKKRQDQEIKEERKQRKKRKRDKKDN